ncbi:MAG: hypothetical protein CMJ95_05275 [Planctomycetes bacterium]|nr:hypothetical protein [Planctomycetota bacterium]
MVNLLKLPISQAVALTALITAICSIWLIGDPATGMPVVSQDVKAQSSLIEQQRQAIDALHLRLARIEGQFDKFSSARADTGVQQLIENLRLDVEDLRSRRSASPDLPLPIAYYLPDGTEPIKENFSEETTVLQEFELRTEVSPEAVVLVQGSSPGVVISVEMLDVNNRWVEVYAAADLSLTPASETWVECSDAPLTGKIRVEVAGERGIEAVGVSTEDAIHWTMASN